MPMPKITITIDERILNEIDARSTAYGYDQNRSLTITRHLDRYFELMRREVAYLKTKLTDNECGLILDATNGVAYLDPWTIAMFWRGIYDAIEVDRLDEKWEINVPEFREKIAHSTYATCAAMVDASTRWWDRVANGEQPEWSELLD